MPLYEYLCHKCGKKFDALQKFSDEPLTVHEEDGGELERLVSPPAFHFKGTGWYVTDYAKSNGVSAPAGDGNKGGSSSGETNGGSKPTESKAESGTKAEPAATSPASGDK